MLEGIIVVFIAGRNNSSTITILSGNPIACVAIQIYHILLSGKPFYLGRIIFPFIFILQGGQEVTPLFAG